MFKARFVLCKGRCAAAGHNTLVHSLRERLRNTKPVHIAVTARVDDADVQEMSGWTCL